MARHRATGVGGRAVRDHVRAERAEFAEVYAHLEPRLWDIVEAIDRGEAVRVNGYELSEVLPGVDVQGSYVVEADGTVTEVG